MHKYFLGAFIAICLMFWTIMAFAAETWQEHTTICQNDNEAMQQFYYDEELLPIMAGAGRIPMKDGSMGPRVIHYIMQDPDGGFAVMRYMENGDVCLVAVGRGTTTDANQMMEWLGIE